MQRGRRLSQALILAAACLLVACGRRTLAVHPVSDSGTDDWGCEKGQMDPVDVEPVLDVHEIAWDTCTSGLDGQEDTAPPSLDVAATEGQEDTAPPSADVAATEGQEDTAPPSADTAVTAEVGLPPCLTNADCAPDAFCSFLDEQVVHCSSLDASTGRSILATPGVCRPILCGSQGCLHKPCTTNLDCNPNETCHGPSYGCGSSLIHLDLVDCAVDCPPVLSNYRSNWICLCQSC